MSLEHEYEAVEADRRAMQWARGLAPATSRLPTLGLFGHSGCGKDTAAEYLAAHTPLRFARSLSWHLAPFCSRRYGHPVETYRGPERHAHAEAMFQEGERLRDETPGILVRSALEHGEIVAGFRDVREVEYAREHDLISLFIYISHRDPAARDPTLRKFGAAPWLHADIVVPNETTLEDFHGRLRRLALACGVPWA